MNLESRLANHNRRILDFILHSSSVPCFTDFLFDASDKIADITLVIAASGTLNERRGLTTNTLQDVKNLVILYAHSHLRSGLS